MYSVMIVDDEVAIREKLPKFIDFKKYGFKLCATAKNGAEALSLLPVHKPDLILLDVRMPVMDGFAFMEALRQSDYRDTKIIILSGYNDFAYAKKAVEYGVKAYLTKPIDEDEAAARLEEIITELESRKIEQIEKNYRQDISDLRQAYNAGSYIKGYEEYILLHIVIRSVQSSYEKIHPYKIISASIAKRINRNDDGLVHTRGSVYTFLVPLDALKYDQNNIESFSKNLLYELHEEELTCAVLVDNCALRSTDIPFRQVFFKHQRAMLTEMSYTTKEYINYTPAANDYDIESFGLLDDAIETLRSNIADLNIELIDRDMQLFFQTIESLKLPVELMQNITYRIYYMLLDMMTTIHQNKTKKPILAPLEWLDRPTFMPFTQWKDIQMQQINDVVTYVKQSRDMSHMGVHKELLEYVYLHYNEPITIKKVADLFHMNSAYLGRVFQKTTGFSFKQYINRLRIAEAKRLLHHTDKLIYEIANGVGFAESSYFIAKFIKEEGISPSEYRKTQ